MLSCEEKHALRAFYLGVLTDELLYFWDEKCLDEEYGGYFNCFSNDGKTLVSTDKYVWSQGRFLWMWSRLASMTDCFDADRRAEFARRADLGQRFLLRHALLDGEGEVRCTFLTDRTGEKKLAPGVTVYDSSIYADCFVVLGFSEYARVFCHGESYAFAKELYRSILRRYESGMYYSLPYPLGRAFYAHAEPMMRTCLAVAMLDAAKVCSPKDTEEYREDARVQSAIVFDTFVDDKDTLHENVFRDGTPAGGLFGTHINPGHTLEDMWFSLEAADACGIDRTDRIARVVRRTFALGWDTRYGGLLHFADGDRGGEVRGDLSIGAAEPGQALVLGDWGSKLWWVHSEALYTTLLMYERTADPDFLHMYEKCAEYTFRTFPNPDRGIREWIQIRARDGAPQDKVVALPVKDPFHIVRNVCKILELLKVDSKE